MCGRVSIEINRDSARVSKGGRERERETIFQLIVYTNIFISIHVRSNVDTRMNNMQYNISLSLCNFISVQSCHSWLWSNIYMSCVCLCIDTACFEILQNHIQIEMEKWNFYNLVYSDVLSAFTYGQSSYSLKTMKFSNNKKTIFVFIVKSL